jgi:hypothetical protein
LKTAIDRGHVKYREQRKIVFFSRTMQVRRLGDRNLKVLKDKNRQLRFFTSKSITIIKCVQKQILLQTDTALAAHLHKEH